MRRHILYIFALFLSVCTLNAQCIQKVRVVEYKGAGVKQPLANVEVIVGNAGSAVTNKQGLCTLQFRTLKPGDKVNVHYIGREGYEVLNPEVLDQWYISKSDDSEYQVVLTKSKFIRSERKKYMRAAEAQVSKATKQERNDISQQFKSNLISQEEYEKKLNELQQRYNEQLDNIDNYIDRIVHTDVNEVGKKEKKVIDLVKHGDIAGAISEYERLNLIEIYQKQIDERNALEMASAKVSASIDQINDSRMKVYESVKRQNDLLIMIGGKENIDAGFNLWRSFAFADTTFFLPLYEYAVYCERSNRVNEALEALKYCRLATDTVSIMRTNLLHAETLIRKKQYEQAMAELEQSYHYMDSARIALNDDSRFLAERGEALIYMCQCYTQLKEVEKGRAIRQPLLETNRELYELNKTNKTFKRFYINALYVAHRSVYHLDYNANISNDSINTDVLIQSHLIEDAIALQEELYADDPVKHTGFLASLYNAKVVKEIEIADDMKARGKKDSARLENIVTEFGKIIGLYKDAYRRNPRAYAHNAAVAYHNYGSFLIEFDLLQDRQKIFGLINDAIRYEEEELAYNPDASHRTICMSLAAYATAAMKYKDYSLAEEYFQKTFDELLPCYKKNPKMYKGTLTTICLKYRQLYGPEHLNNPAKISEMDETVRQVEAEQAKNK